MDNVKIILKSECVGCEACVQVCPFGAIKMIENEEGFYFPSVDVNCVLCGKCLNVCPVYSKPKRQRVGDICFAGVLRNRELLTNSASGGAFPAVVKILGEQVIVYGAHYNVDLVVEHTCRPANEITIFQGSKYVQSRIKDSYITAKTYLEKGYSVLFTGTPCQIAALKLFLGKDYSDLFCVEIICHGVGSPGVFRTYLKELENSYHSKVISYTFRNKSSLKGGWRDFVTRIEFANGKVKNTKYDSFMRSFLNNLLLRECCYNCKYRGYERCSDLVLADFWGIEHLLKTSFPMKRGVSLIIPVSAKGESVCMRLSSQMLIQTQLLEKAIAYNRQFVYPTPLPENREKLFEGYLEGINVLDLLTSSSLKGSRLKRFVSDIYHIIK